MFQRKSTELEGVVFLCLCVYTTLIHSFTADTPYEVFVSLNEDNGDVYAGQCALGKSLILTVR